MATAWLAFCCILQSLSQIYDRLQVSPEPQAEGLESIQHGFVARCRLAQVDHCLQGFSKGYCYIVGPDIRRLGQGLARRQQRLLRGSQEGGSEWGSEESSGSGR